MTVYDRKENVPMKMTAALKATWHTYRTQFPQMLLTLLLLLAMLLL